MHTLLGIITAGLSTTGEIWSGKKDEIYTGHYNPEYGTQ